VVSTPTSFPCPQHITEFVVRVTTGATSGTGTAYASEAREFNPGFSGVRVARHFVFCVAFCRSSFVLLPFFYWPLCCLPFFHLRILITPFDIFKLFLPKIVPVIVYKT
jgi:hypothetical protein